MGRSTDFYKTYYMNQVQQKGGNLPAFHGAPTQRGYGLGSILKGLFRWAVPKVSTAAKAVGRAALKEGVGLAQDIVEGKDWRSSALKRGKKIGNQSFQELKSQNASQAGGGKKATKRRAPTKSNQSVPTKRQKTSPTKRGKKAPYAIYD